MIAILFCQVRAVGKQVQDGAKGAVGYFAQLKRVVGCVVAFLVLWLVVEFIELQCLVEEIEATLHDGVAGGVLVSLLLTLNG